MMGMARTTHQPDRDKCAEAAEVCACFHFRKASRAVTQLYDEMLQPVGLRSTQFVILVAIYLHEPVTPGVLSRELVLDRSTLSRNIKPLESQGLVRVQNTAGQKRHRLALTAKGRQTVAKAIPLWEKAQEQFVSNMGKNNWSTMLAGLHKAVDATRQ